MNGEEVLGFENQVIQFKWLIWFDHPARHFPWKMHIIDTVRCQHPIATADLGGDGAIETDTNYMNQA